MTDFSDSRDLRGRDLALKFGMEEEEEDLKALLDLPQGRRFLRRLLEETGIYSGSFTGDSRTFFNEGRRDVGLWLRERIVSANPAAYAALTLGDQDDNDRD